MLRPFDILTSADLRASLRGETALTVAHLKAIARHAIQRELEDRHAETADINFPDSEEDLGANLINGGSLDDMEVTL